MLLYIIKYENGCKWNKYLQILFTKYINLKYFKNFFTFLAVLGFCCSVQAFSSCSGQRLLFIAVRGLLIALASLAAKHGL